MRNILVELIDKDRSDDTTILTVRASGGVMYRATLKGDCESNFPWVRDGIIASLSKPDKRLS